MVDNNILDEMDLPMSSSNEDIETISSNYFKPLFDVKKFEIRSEPVRDKGIDFHIELKRTNNKSQIVYTNFRFVIQLKATDKTDINKDGSISLQLNTSNINYLLNNSMPAFYVLYVSVTNSFYYEDINSFVKTLYEKDENWDKQPSHALRFSKLLDPEGIEKMYTLTSEKGKFQRTINEKTIIHSLNLNTGNKILIDPDLNIIDDAHIKKIIEDFGLFMINEGKWKEVLEIHKKGSANIASTGKYNLVLGIANYYIGNPLEAITSFKIANKLGDLDEELKNHLLFFDATVKNSIGLLSNDELNKRINSLEKANNLGLYIKLDKIKNSYIESLNDETENKFERFESAIHELLIDPNASENIKFNARCDLLFFKGLKNNTDFARKLAFIKSVEEEKGIDLPLRYECTEEQIIASTDWLRKISHLKSETKTAKNYFIFHLTLLTEVRVCYEFDIWANLIPLTEMVGFPKHETLDKKEMFKEQLIQVDFAYNYFNRIGHIDNVIACLFLKYEILHYIEEYDSAAKIMGELESIQGNYELIELKSKLDILKINGPTHQKVKIWIVDLLKESEQKQKKQQEEIDDLARMDEEERNGKYDLTSYKHTIHLFPIGYFMFPNDKKEFVFKILKITPEAEQTFNSMLERGIIPIANIYNSPILKEGLANGFADFQGTNNWSNLYRVRKEFYENKFYKTGD